MKFAQFIELLTQDNGNQSNYYLEYFPVPVLLNLAQEFLRQQNKDSGDGERNLFTSRKHFSKFKSKIPDNLWSQFLSLRYHLLWISGGNISSHHHDESLETAPSTTVTDVTSGLKQQQAAALKLSANNEKESIPTDTDINARSRDTSAVLEEFSEKKSKKTTSTDSGTGASGATASSTSRLHFDRYENIMNVIQGTKTFYLFPPSASASLYGGSPVISGSFSAVPVSTHVAEGNVHGGDSSCPPHAQCQSTRAEQTDHTASSSSVPHNNVSSGYKFLRDVRTVQFVPNAYHTYSPVNILRPDFQRFPKLEAALRAMQVCEVQAGDRIFVPAHWWHQASGVV